MIFINVKTGEYPLTLEGIKKRINVSLGADTDLLAYGFAQVIPTPAPACTKYQYITESKPKLVNNNWIQQWSIKDLAGEALENATIANALSEQYEAFSVEYKKVMSTNLPDWKKVEAAIEKIDSLEGAKSFLHQLSRVVYLLAKRSID